MKTGVLAQRGGTENPTNLIFNGNFENWLAGPSAPPNGWLVSDVGQYSTRLVPAFTSAYVRAASQGYGAATNAADPANVGSWVAGPNWDFRTVWQMDLGVAQIAKRIYYENMYPDTRGVKDFTFWGTNDINGTGTWNLKRMVSTPGGVRRMAIYNGKLYCAFSGDYWSVGHLDEYVGVETYMPDEQYGAFVNKGTAYVGSLVVLDDKLYCGGVYGANSGQLLEWNGEDGFILRAPALSVAPITEMVVLSGKIYAISTSAGTLLEWNGTDAWTVVAPLLTTNTFLLSLAVLGGKIYAGGDGRLLEWNGTDAWAEVAPKPDPDVYAVYSLAVFDGKLYGGTGGTGYQWGANLLEWNGTDAWIRKTTGGVIINEQCLSLVVWNNELYGGTYQGGSIWKWNGVDEWVYAFGTAGVGSYIGSMIIFNDKIYAAGAAYFCGVRENILFDDTTYGVEATANFLIGGTASDDDLSPDPLYVPAKAVDGNVGTRWENAGATALPHWWKYDLGVGVTKMATSIRIYGKANDITAWQFQGSNNNADWTSLYTGGEILAGWNTYSFVNATAYRYYRVYITAGADPNVVSFYEIEAYERTWTQIVTDETFFQRHSPTVDPDYQSILVTNSTAYRFYRFEFSTRWPQDPGQMDHPITGCRKIFIQTEGETTVTVAKEESLTKLGIASARITRDGTDCSMLQSVNLERGLDYWKGRYVTFGCWVYATLANTARISLDDGDNITSSVYHTGNSTWQYLVISHLVSMSATELTGHCDVINTAHGVAYFDGASIMDGQCAYAYSDKPIPRGGQIASDTDETKFSHKVPVYINGTLYYIMLTTS